MKLYVWENVLTDYTSGIMFAVAEDVLAARLALVQNCGYIPDADLAQTPKEFDMSSPVAFTCWGGG